jgi:hypothetical protein
MVRERSVARDRQQGDVRFPDRLAARTEFRSGLWADAPQPRLAPEGWGRSTLSEAVPELLGE